MTAWFHALCDIPDCRRRADLLRRWLCAGGLLLVGCTWKLWTPQQVFPQVPLFAPWGLLPPAVEWLGTLGLLLGLMAGLLAPAGRLANGALLLFTASAAGLMLVDQQRMQPWAYQFVLLALALAGARPRASLGLIRLLVISFYFHSALTKCDFSFLHTLGQQFLEVLVGLTGDSIDRWPLSARLWSAALFPLGELFVAVLLLVPRGRTLGLVAAIVLHLLLIVILGPWGLQHRPGVLAWNLYFIGQDLLLFWPGRLPGAALEGAPEPVGPLPKWLAAVYALAIVLPVAEPLGWWDMWPSWGLYASSAERVLLEVHRNERPRLPAELLPFVEEPADPNEPWLRVRLDRWALASLDAPIYPNHRVQLGVALAVVAGSDLGHQARIIRLGQAARWDGARQSEVLIGPIQAEAAAGEYLFNARPRRASRRPP